MAQSPDWVKTTKKYPCTANLSKSIKNGVPKSSQSLLDSDKQIKLLGDEAESRYCKVLSSRMLHELFSYKRKQLHVPDCGVGAAHLRLHELNKTVCSLSSDLNLISPGFSQVEQAYDAKTRLSTARLSSAPFQMRDRQYLVKAAVWVS